MLKIHGIDGKPSQFDRSLQYQANFGSGREGESRQRGIIQARVAGTIGSPTSNLRTKIDPATGDIVGYFAKTPQKEPTKN